MRHSLDPLFNPTSVAVIGASTVLHKTGGRRWRSMVGSGFAGPLYLAANVVFGGWFGIGSIRVVCERDEVREPNARRLFGISILYLFALFAALIAERSFGVAGFAALMAG